MDSVDDNPSLHPNGAPSSILSGDKNDNMTDSDTHVRSTLFNRVIIPSTCQSHDKCSSEDDPSNNLNVTADEEAILNPPETNNDTINYIHSISQIHTNDMGHPQPLPLPLDMVKSHANTSHRDMIPLSRSDYTMFREILHFTDEMYRLSGHNKTSSLVKNTRRAPHSDLRVTPLLSALSHAQHPRVQPSLIDPSAGKHSKLIRQLYAFKNQITQVHTPTSIHSQYSPILSQDQDGLNISSNQQQYLDSNTASSECHDKCSISYQIGNHPSLSTVDIPSSSPSLQNDDNGDGGDGGNSCNDNDDDSFHSQRLTTQIDAFRRLYDRYLDTISHGASQDLEQSPLSSSLLASQDKPPDDSGPNPDMDIDKLDHSQEHKPDMASATTTTSTSTTDFTQPLPPHSLSEFIHQLHSQLTDMLNTCEVIMSTPPVTSRSRPGHHRSTSHDISNLHPSETNQMHHGETTPTPTMTTMITPSMTPPSPGIVPMPPLYLDVDGSVLNPSQCSSSYDHHQQQQQQQQQQQPNHNNHNHDTVIRPTREEINEQFMTVLRTNQRHGAQPLQMETCPAKGKARRAMLGSLIDDNDINRSSPYISNHSECMDPFIPHHTHNTCRPQSSSEVLGCETPRHSGILPPSSIVHPVSATTTPQLVHHHPHRYSVPSSMIGIPSQQQQQQQQQYQQQQGTQLSLLPSVEGAMISNPTSGGGGGVIKLNNNSIGTAPGTSTHAPVVKITDTQDPTLQCNVLCRVNYCIHKMQPPLHQQQQQQQQQQQRLQPQLTQTQTLIHHPYSDYSPPPTMSSSYQYSIPPSSISGTAPVPIPRQTPRTHASNKALNKIPPLIARDRYTPGVFYTKGSNIDKPRGLWSSDPTNNFFSWREISQHNQPNDCWLVVNDMVYEVTAMLKTHPAGIECIVRFGGTDATRHFDFHPSHAQKQWKQYHIGYLEGADPKGCTMF